MADLNDKQDIYLPI